MILCAGEALIDMLPRQSTEGEAAFAPVAGGAVFNTAIALGRLDVPVSFFSGLSTDLFGAVLENALTESHVNATLAHRSPKPTTLAFVKLVDGQAQYAFYDEGTAGRMLSEADLPQIPDACTALFCGGISLVVEPCANAYRALFLREAPHRLTMLDPNIRPGFIDDETAYRKRLSDMMSVADIVKLSDEDLHWLEGPGNTTDIARGLLARGPRMILITEGAKGAVAHTGAGHLAVPAKRVDVVDTVGAGDTFNAGFLAGLHRADAFEKTALDHLVEDDLAAAVALGIRAAGVTVSRAGANPPWTQELA